MIKRIIEKIKKEYAIRIKHIDAMEYQIERMRNAGYKIGKNCKLYSALGTPEPYLVTIGDNVTVSGDVVILTHDNAPIKVMGGQFTDTVGRIVIGNNCFIGARSTIMPGVQVADNVIIAAGSVVSKSVTESNVIVAGNPAVILDTWDNYREKNYKKFFCFECMTAEQKMQEILKNNERYIVRGQMKWRRKSE